MATIGLATMAEKTNGPRAQARMITGEEARWKERTLLTCKGETWTGLAGVIHRVPGFAAGTPRKDGAAVE